MPPKQKRENRPRLDAIIRHIKAGSYDEDMSQLQGAIADRQRKRQEAVVGMVKEVFGTDYTVLPESQTPLQPRPRPGGPVDPELKAAEERARAEEARLAAEQEGITEDPLGSDDDSGFESRSPLIGSIDPAAQPVEEEPGVTIEVIEAEPDTEPVEFQGKTTTHTVE